MHEIQQLIKDKMNIKIFSKTPYPRTKGALMMLQKSTKVESILLCVVNPVKDALSS